jgi:hypothetical protein
VDAPCACRRARARHAGLRPFLERDAPSWTGERNCVSSRRPGAEAGRLGGDTRGDEGRHDRRAGRALPDC